MAPFQYWEPYNRRPVRRQRAAKSRRVTLAPHMQAPNRALLQALQEFVHSPQLSALDQNASSPLPTSGTRPWIH